jgi:hypothetical protein
MEEVTGHLKNIKEQKCYAEPDLWVGGVAQVVEHEALRSSPSSTTNKMLMQRKVGNRLQLHLWLPGEEGEKPEPQPLGRPGSPGATN